MDKELKITISKDGRELRGLYDDQFDWQDLGELHIERATDIVFNKKRQVWVIQILDEGRRELDAGYAKRRDAILAEVEYLNNRGMYN